MAVGELQGSQSRRAAKDRLGESACRADRGRRFEAPSSATSWNVNGCVRFLFFYFDRYIFYGIYFYCAFYNIIIFHIIFD